MKQNEVMHGFAVRSVKEIPEQKATLYQLEYLKNGAQLIWLDNGENNKLFTAAFQTLPSDDTGVFHILEHSVLCGSKKYPVKDPFLNLLKSSMNTFLNAVTFSDKTMYPVSSRNEADFLNLVRVYLDAVFCPAIFGNPLIFCQEGWHYEWEGEAADPIYKGVVFNEMKGAFSSVDTLIGNGLNRMLFPDTCYQYVSGGDPKQIPTLTYEQFLDAHRKYYHPSNAKFYLDGDVPLEQILTILDEEYLSHYGKSKEKYEIGVQQPVASKRTVEYYGIGEEEALAGNAHMAFGKLLCDYKDRMKITAVMILASYLTGSNEAPLKQAIIGNGLGQDVTLGVWDSIAQPYCSIRIYNTEYEDREEIKRVLRETVEDLLKEGLDQEELTATINQLEFRFREEEEPRGLMRCMNVFQSWLYGGEPELYLENDGVFRALRQAVDTDYYADLLRSIMLDWEHMAEFYLLPSRTKEAEDQKAECEALKKKKKAWTEQEKQEILDRNRKLQEWQSSPDSEEALQTIPVLSLQDIGAAPEQLSTKKARVGEIPVLFHSAEDSGIVHFNLYFTLADCRPEDLGRISFMTNILGLLPTRKHSVFQLQREIKKHIGFLDYNILCESVPGQREKCQPYFAVTCSVLKSQMEKAVELLMEILNETRYDGDQSARLIHDILLQCNEGMRQDIIENGHRFATMRALSHFSAEGIVKEQSEGYSFYRWINDFCRQFEKDMEGFQECAKKVQETIFTIDRLKIGLTADTICDEWNLFAQKLKKGSGSRKAGYMELLPDNRPAKEIIRIPAGVSYAVNAGHLDCYGTSYSGKLDVLATILSYDYLWNEVRVKGGAYGCGFQAGINGNIGFYSYRDPDPVASTETYRKSGDYVRRFCESAESIDKYIISTIAGAEPLQGLRDRGIRADEDVLRGMTPEDRKHIRDEMLHTGKEDLPALSDLLDRMAENHALCIVGNVETKPDDDYEIMSL